MNLACTLLEQATLEMCMKSLVIFVSCAPARKALEWLFANIDGGGPFLETSAQSYIRASRLLILKPGIPSDVWQTYLAQARRLNVRDRERAAVQCLQVIVR